MTEEDFKRQRRMFAIVKKEVKIAPTHVEWSHTEWFDREGWKFDANVVRGYFDKTGLYAYCGDKFAFTKDAEEVFRKHIPEIADRMILPAETFVYGGANQSECEENGTRFPPRTELGVLRELLREAKG